MSEFINVRHSFNAGDLITILPGLRQIYRDFGKKIKIFQRIDFNAHFYDNQINSTVNENGESVCMNRRLFLMMKPLIEAQDYIESFDVWEGQKVRFDYDITRDRRSIPLPYGLIHTWGEGVFPETSTDLSEAWIFTGFDGIITNIKYSNKVIINRTQRYNNPYLTYHFLKPYEDQLLFSGTKIEYDEFCEKNKLDIEFLVVNNFYELTKVIEQCRFGIYSQSLHWHLADAVKVKRVLEVSAMFPNTFSTGKNGYHAYSQEAMEFYVNKLINQ